MGNILVVSGSVNYADEFDIPYLTKLNEKELVELRDKLTGSEKDIFEIYFGTNEALEIDKKDLLSMLEGAKEYGDRDLEILEDLGLGEGIFNIFEHLDWLQEG